MEVEKEIQKYIHNDSDFEKLNELKNYEPSWQFMFFNWMTKSMLEDFFDKINDLFSNPMIYIIKGLQYEYGIKKEINYQKALNYYIQGALLNNQYCFFKLFFIVKDKSKEFNLERNLDLAILLLIKASCYNEPFLDFNKIDPIIKLYNIIYNDRSLVKVKKVLDKYRNDHKEYTFGIVIDDVEYNYLFYFLNLNFSQYTEIFKNSLKQLETISEENNHLEATHKLACLYYNPINKEIFAKDTEKSLYYFRKLRSLHYIKCYSSYYKVCDDLGINEDNESLLKISVKFKLFTSHLYGNYLTRNKEKFFENSAKIFHYFSQAFLSGNIICLVICFEILSQIFIKKFHDVNSNNNKYKIDVKNFLTIIFDFVSTKKTDEQFIKLLDYDVLILFHQIHGYFYYKGILVKKDLEKAIEIFSKPLDDKKSVKNYRKIYYYLGKSYEKIGNFEKSNFYYKKAFDIYVLLKEFPYHHYLVGKMFLKGVHVKKRMENAFYFFSLGANYKENYFFINSLYSIKCGKYLLMDEFQDMKDNMTGFKFNLDKFVNEENLCVVCFSNYKQIIFLTCGHKAICNICLDKMKENNSNSNSHQCPLCMQKSISIINDVC